MRANGIPEEGIILYGNVTNANRALRSGHLTVECSGPSGKVVRVTTQMTNSGASGYCLLVPFAAMVGGNTAATDAFMPEAGLVIPEKERALVREVNVVVAGTLPSRGPIRLAEARIPMADPGPQTASRTA